MTRPCVALARSSASFRAFVSSFSQTEARASQGITMNFSQLGLLATIRTTSLTVDVSRLLQSLRRTPLPAGVEFAEPCFSFILFVFIRFFFHCLPSACPAFACVSHQTEASPMARASVLGCLGGAKVVTGFEGEGKAWREFCRRKRPGERGKTELFFPPVPLPSHWGGGRKHRGRRDRQEVSAKQKALKIKNSNLVQRSASTFRLGFGVLRVPFPPESSEEINAVEDYFSPRVGNSANRLPD